MGGSPTQAPSLRVWLQSTSLLAVVAGYSVLLLLNQRMADWQRQEGFRQVSEQVLSSLAGRAANKAMLTRLLPAPLLPGVVVDLAAGDANSDSGPISAQTDQGQELLVARMPLDLVDGDRVFLLIRQDVTGSVQQERLSFWLLVAAAGISSLVTSALLRPVLKEGLVQPLENFGNQLRSIHLPPTLGDAISVDAQPKELQPIATAFNGLHHRLWTSWEQERIFADGVAHELRTPITLISGHVQSLLRQGAPEALTPSLHLIRNEAERMTSLISDLLDLARVDSQRLALEQQTVRADETLLLLYERLVFKGERRLQLDPGLDDASDLPVGKGDPQRIQQCLTALVDNALRYSPAEGVVTLASSTGRNGELILHVRDEGPGVPEHEREKIFDRFVRGSAAAAGDSRGSGIGLAVVKLLMEAMGGLVVVCDATGGGADFQLHLQPFRPSDPPPS